jgi:hypothetical protein
LRSYNEKSFTQILNYIFQWLAFGVILAGILILILIVMLVIRSRVRLAVALISETSK